MSSSSSSLTTSSFSGRMLLLLILFCACELFASNEVKSFCYYFGTPFLIPFILIQSTSVLFSCPSLPMNTMERNLSRETGSNTTNSQLRQSVEDRDKDKAFLSSSPDAYMLSLVRVLEHNLNTRHWNVHVKTTAGEVCKLSAQRGYPFHRTSLRDMWLLLGASQVMTRTPTTTSCMACIPLICHAKLATLVIHSYLSMGMLDDAIRNASTLVSILGDGYTCVLPRYTSLFEAMFRIAENVVLELRSL